MHWLLGTADRMSAKIQCATRQQAAYSNRGSSVWWISLLQSLLLSRLHC